MDINKLGLKGTLILTVIALVSMAVIISGSLSYMRESANLTQALSDSARQKVESQAQALQYLFSDKIGSVKQIAERFQESPLTGDPVDNAKSLAAAMNLTSSVITFDNGDAFWNQASGNWPNHKYNGDATQRSWYKLAQQSAGVSITDPYPGSDGLFFWISIVSKMPGGVISADMDLRFLNDVVSEAVPDSDAVALIITEDTMVLASTSKVVKNGELAAEVPGFGPATVELVKHDSYQSEYTLDGEQKLLFSKRISAANQHWYFLLALNKDATFAALDDAKREAVITFVLCLIGAALASLLALRLAYRPIQDLRAMVEDLSQGNGDLTRRLSVQSNDDLGAIATGINQFVTKLQQMLLEIFGATSELDTKARLLKQQSDANLEVLKRHVSETEQVVAAVEEMNATSASVADSAASTAKYTQEANHAGSQSLETLAQSRQTVGALRQDVDSAATSVVAMSNETQNINSILEVIRAIAEQTNLLALNAAIEAARAGEQGRGFAVVADEVRNLAGRTKSSTTEIEDALSRLLSGNQQLEEAMGATTNRCGQTEEGTSAVGDSLEKMSGFVLEIHDLTSQIASAAEQQSAVSNEVSRNISTIREMALSLEEQTRLSDQEAQHIARINDNLAEIVRRFKLS